MLHEGKLGTCNKSNAWYKALKGVEGVGLACCLWLLASEVGTNIGLSAVADGKGNMRNTFSSRPPPSSNNTLVPPYASVAQGLVTGVSLGFVCVCKCMHVLYVSVFVCVCVCVSMGGGLARMWPG